MYQSDDKVDFYGTVLWNYYDGSISNNSLNFGYYGMIKNDKDLYAPKFKIDIRGKTADKSSSIVLDSSMLYRLTYTIKNEVLNGIKEDLNKFKQDQKWSHGFVFKTYKKNLYVTVMWNDLANQAVIRFMIGEKEQTILDSDKVYVPILDFFAMCEIMKQAFNQYITFTNQCLIQGELIKLQTSITNLEFTQRSLNKPVSNNNPLDMLSVETLGISSKQSEEKVETVKPLDILNVNLETTKKVEPEIKKEPKSVVEEKKIESEVKEEKTESSEQQENFDDFLKKNRDSFELDMPYQPEESPKDKELRESKRTSELDNVESKFISKVCKNDFSVLEQLVFNMISNDLPLDTFVDVVKKETDIDLSDGIDKNQYSALNYLICNNLKLNLSNLLEKKIPLPNSITPIIVENSNRTDEKIDVMYYLLIFYIYLAKVKTVLSEKSKNSLDNKEFFSYILKAITNSIVFSYFKHIPIEVFERELGKRYNNLWDKGFFDNFIKNVNEKIKVNGLRIATDDIIENFKGIYNSVNKFSDKLSLENSFNGSKYKITYKRFIDGTNLEISTIAKICKFEICFMKFGKIIDKAINLTSYDDIPVDILKLYGITIAKFDTSILLKYVTENYKDFADLEQIKKINKNVYDILDSINLEQYDDKILRALYFWDVDELPKSLTYYQFKNMIDKSTLEKSQLVSMIVNKEKVTDPTFYNSFLVAASDNV